MPRVLINYNKVLPMFTADRAVGRNAPNDRLDVLFVQFLLFMSISTNTGWWENSIPQPTVPRGLRVATPVAGVRATLTHPKPQGDIVIDGICGDQTIGFIEYFQEQMQLARRGVELNGQVAPYGTAGTTSMQLLSEGLLYTEGYGPLYIMGGFPNELKSLFYY
jgi:hypothetical protein